MTTKGALVQGYARALFAVADAEGELDRVEDELFRFGKAVEAAPALRDALSDPNLPADSKRSVVAEILGPQATAHTASLLGFVIEQGRAKDLPRIIAALEEVAAERRQQVVGEVRTAVPLDDARRKKLAAALSRATGKEIDLKVLVDENVIGGVVARVGDQVFDGTIRRKLELARQQMAKVR